MLYHKKKFLKDDSFLGMTRLETLGTNIWNSAEQGFDIL